MLFVRVIRGGAGAVSVADSRTERVWHRQRIRFHPESQWRFCFRWTEAGPEDVQIAGYH